VNHVETLVRTALQERGVPASHEEIEALVAAYPAFKARVESLYAVTDARHEQPAVSFVPNTNVAEW
jgi:hypothetical protein